MAESILANNIGSVYINANFLTTSYKADYNDLNSEESVVFKSSIQKALAPQFVANNIILQNIDFTALRNDPMSADMNIYFEIQREMTEDTIINNINVAFIKSFGSNVTITYITIIQFPKFASSKPLTQSSLENTIANSKSTADAFTNLQTSGNKVTTVPITSEINTTTNTYFSTMPSSINSILLPSTTAGSTQLTQSSLANTIANSSNTSDTFTTLQTSINKDITATITTEINTTTKTYFSTMLSSINSTLLPSKTAVTVKSTEFPPFAIALIVATSAILIIAAMIIIIEISKLCTSNISKLKNDSDFGNF